MHNTTLNHNLKQKHIFPFKTRTGLFLRTLMTAVINITGYTQKIHCFCKVFTALDFYYKHNIS